VTQRLPLVATALRVLSFRATRAELLAVDNRHLALGLACTWLVGMGRYWDNPRASLLQHLGVGSVVYVFVLSALLWLVMKPLRPADWSYRRLLTFVCLTSPPAALYALPVERWMSIDAARSANAWFLALVAAWRLALLCSYLARVGRLGWLPTAVGALLPMTGIIVALTALNLEHVVFQIMGGLDDASPHSTSYGVLVMLTMLSMVAAPVLLLAYGALALSARPRT
jgi:hypothetical protein